MALPHVILTEAYRTKWREFLEFHGSRIELDLDEINRVGETTSSLEGHPRLLSMQPLIITLRDHTQIRCLEAVERDGEVSITFFTKTRAEFEAMQSVRLLMQRSGAAEG